MYQFETYTDMRQKIGEYFQEGKHAEAADILEWGLKEFPDHLFANIFNLAIFRVQLEQYDKVIEALKYGLDQGVWFGPFELGAGIWDPIREMAEFQDIQNRCKQCQEKAQEQAKPKLEVLTPKDFDPNKVYPLFIALHGGGETVEAFKPQWTSPKLEQDFIVAYPQSSRVISMTGFSWMGELKDHQEVFDAYQSMTQSYPIDRNRVIMGGFSAGGHQTLTLLLDEDQSIPLRGFVILCPPIPEEYSEDAIARIKARSQKGLLLTTEMDGRVGDQQKFAEALQEGGVDLKFEITPNIGHWYPENLAEKIDESIDFILS